MYYYTLKRHQTMAKPLNLVDFKICYDLDYNQFVGVNFLDNINKALITDHCKQVKLFVEFDYLQDINDKNKLILASDLKESELVISGTAIVKKITNQRLSIIEVNCYMKFAYTDMTALKFECRYKNNIYGEIFLLGNKDYHLSNYIIKKSESYKNDILTIKIMQITPVKKYYSPLDFSILKQLEMPIFGWFYDMSNHRVYYYGNEVTYVKIDDFTHEKIISNRSPIESITIYDVVKHSGRYEHITDSIESVMLKEIKSLLRESNNAQNNNSNVNYNMYDDDIMDYPKRNNNDIDGVFNSDEKKKFAMRKIKQSIDIKKEMEERISYINTPYNAYQDISPQTIIKLINESEYFKILCSGKWKMEKTSHKTILHALRHAPFENQTITDMLNLIFKGHVTIPNKERFIKAWQCTDYFMLPYTQLFLPITEELHTYDPMKILPNIKESKINYLTELCYLNADQYSLATKNALFDAFQYQYVLFNVLQSILSPNVVIAGGFVLAQLIDIPYGDIDIFIIESDKQRAKEYFKSTYNSLKQVLDDYQIYQSDFAITLIGKIDTDSKKLYKIQVIMAYYDSLETLFNEFDLDCCCCAYNGTNIIVSPRCINLTNTVDSAHFNQAYAKRLYKYYERGIAIKMPKYSLNSIVNHCETGLHELICYMEFNVLTNEKSIYNKHMKLVDNVDIDNLQLSRGFTEKFKMSEEEWYALYYPQEEVVYPLQKSISIMDLIATDLKDFNIKYVNFETTNVDNIFKIRYKGKNLRLILPDVFQNKYFNINNYFNTNDYFDINEHIKKFLNIIINIIKLNPKKILDADTYGISSLTHGIPLEYASKWMTHNIISKIIYIKNIVYCQIHDDLSKEKIYIDIQSDDIYKNV
jgi:hypothetical protein